MSKRRYVVGLATTAALASSLVFGIAFADENYQPKTLGNSSYSNYTDLRNDIYVQGMDYVGSMSAQNNDFLNETAGISNQIGQQEQDAYALRLTNKLSQDITKLEMKSCDKDSYTDLGLKSSIASGKDACWWYVQEYLEYSVTNTVGKSYTSPVNYSFKATLADGSTVVFHDINMKGVLSLAFCFSDTYEVNYVERMTLTNHTPDPTLYYEYNLARGYSDDTDTTYSAEEFNYHVNSAVRMANRCFTEARGDGWDANVPSDYSSVDYSPDFGVYVPLYGEPSGDYTNKTYEYLYWNPQLIKWRVSNGDAGVWGSAASVSGAGEYGNDNERVVDYHPGMEEGDWTYLAGE